MLETFRETPRSQADRHAAPMGGGDRPGPERYRGEDRSVTAARPGASIGPREVTPDRAARIAEIRRQIADGTYETDGKIDRAVHGLLDDLSP